MTQAATAAGDAELLVRDEQVRQHRLILPAAVVGSSLLGLIVAAVQSRVVGLAPAATWRRQRGGVTKAKAMSQNEAAASPEMKEQVRTQCSTISQGGEKGESPPKGSVFLGRARPNSAFMAETRSPGPRPKVSSRKAGLRRASRLRLVAAR